MEILLKEEYCNEKDVGVFLGLLSDINYENIQTILGYIDSEKYGARIKSIIKWIENNKRFPNAESENEKERECASNIEKFQKYCIKAADNRKKYSVKLQIILSIMQTLEIDIDSIEFEDNVRSVLKKNGIEYKDCGELVNYMDFAIGHFMILSERRAGRRKPLYEKIDLRKMKVDELIAILSKLEQFGINLKYVCLNDDIARTLERMESVENIQFNKEELIKAGIPLEYKIGRYIDYANEWSNDKMLKKFFEQPDKKTAIEKINKEVDFEKAKELYPRTPARRKEEYNLFFMEITKKLYEIGVDLSEIKNRDKIIDVLKKQQDRIEDKIGKIPEDEEGIKELESRLGIRLNYSIGIAISTVKAKKSENDKHNPLTQEQEKILLDRGLTQLIKEKKDTFVSDFIDCVQKLEKMGVDISRIDARDKVKSILGEKLNYSDEEIMEIENSQGLSANFRVGDHLHKIRKTLENVADIESEWSTAKRFNFTVTKEQYEEMKALGVILEPTIWENVPNTMKVFENIHSLGVDLSGIKPLDTVETFLGREPNGEELLARLKELNLDKNDRIGVMAKNIRYKRKCKSKKYLDDEMIEKLDSMGFDWQEKITKEKLYNAVKSSDVDKQESQATTIRGIMDGKKVDFKNR